MDSLNIVLNLNLELQKLRLNTVSILDRGREAGIEWKLIRNDNCSYIV